MMIEKYLQQALLTLKIPASVFASSFAAIGYQFSL